ncbi:hypothetical protein [Pseudoteredinibacter isoporae]|uniref:Uncharacterized protein n=1 Tax=Pseudoteredinibacter isoporae TaxID=570281 RepID=A0A7X0JUP5_9GAMM|nr:hypothetical protein [Pseudoteredinibacter isoporae]MBB6522612.1 hypothetical protein [Pseudoteredinibacter isoporae]NHO88142.1 hypothetical protein [Pseudoteredinibacter isoporae]NIB23527.1 hypothetical protein [Pseudoteredinibacter isoporae]
MKVKSKLADIDFEFGHFEYKKDHLIIHSHPDQSMQSKVYVSPDDVVSALGKALKVPMVWLYILAFPVFLIRYRRRKNQKLKAGQKQQPK